MAFDVWSPEKVTALSAIFLTMLSANPADVTRVELKPVTLQAFDTYIRKTEARLDASREPDYLWCDGTPVRKARIRKGDVLAEPWIADGDVEIPDGLIHHWVGSVFIPGVTLAKTLALVQDYNNHKAIYKPEVLASHLVAHHGNDYKVNLRLLKKQLITVVLNTDHEVRYRPLDAARCSSRSYSTRIAEVEDAGTAGERELPPGSDHGFLWRLNSYWRFQERDGGVYVECEAVSLSRGVPAGLGWLINPIVRRLPRQSLANTLAATRAALTR